MQQTAIRVAALASLGAGAVHAAVVTDHAEVWWVSGLFFGLLTAYQLGWGLLALWRPTALNTSTFSGKVLVWSSVAVNGGSAVMWAVTRWITGEPFGPQAGTPLPIGPAGIASTLLEVLMVVLLLAASSLATRHVSGRGVAVALLASGLVLAGPTAWGLNGAMAHDHGSHSDDHGTDDHHDDDETDGHNDGDGHHDDKTGETADPQKGDGESSKRKNEKKQSSDSEKPSDDGHEDDGHAH